MRIKSMSVDLDPKAFTFESMRQLVDEFLKASPHEAKKFWDCMTALRGPDQGYQAGPAYIDGHDSAALQAAQDRKNQTTAIIRARVFPGAAGCSAAQMNNDPEAVVQLPSKEKWDHFDKHCFKACLALTIPYQIGGGPVEGLPQPKAVASKGYELLPDPICVNVYLPGCSWKQPEFAKGRVFLVVAAGQPEQANITLKGLWDGMTWGGEFDNPADIKHMVNHHHWMVLEYKGDGTFTFAQARPTQGGKNAMPKNKWISPGDPKKLWQVKHVTMDGFANLVKLAMLVQAKADSGKVTPEGPWYDESNNVVLTYQPGLHLYTFTLPLAAKPVAADGTSATGGSWINDDPLFDLPGDLPDDPDGGNS